MSRAFKSVLLILAALAIFGALVLVRRYYNSRNVKVSYALTGIVANTATIIDSIKNDSSYKVKDVVYRDSAIMIALSDQDKTGTETYFNKKYKLNNYDNINMVFIYSYDTSKPLSKVSFDEAMLAVGKKMGRFQNDWTSHYIDTTDGSCKPLRTYIVKALKVPASYKNDETVYQPASIHKMLVICKYHATDSTGNKIESRVSAVVDTAGNLSNIEKLQ